MASFVEMWNLDNRECLCMHMHVIQKIDRKLSCHIRHELTNFLQIHIKYQLNIQILCALKR